METKNEKKGKFNLNDAEDTLKRELEEQAQAMQEEPQADVSEEDALTMEEQAEYDYILDVLEGHSLTSTDIANIKDRFGKVYVYVWDKDHAYVYRALMRKEWNLIRQLADGDEAKAMSHVIRAGCIYPQIESEQFFDEELAGFKDTFGSVIMRTSGFISLDEALLRVREL